MNSFRKFLVTLPTTQAIQHVYDCLANGEPNNEAWELMSEVHGDDWKCPKESLGSYIHESILYLRTKKGEK